MIELAPGLSLDDYTKTTNANGSITLTSAQNTITYTSDGNPVIKECEEDVTPDDPEENDKPFANNDRFTTKKGEVLKITAAQLLANDVDLNGGTLSLVSVGEDEHGTAVLHSNGTITFTPKAGFTGNTSFSYQVTDGQGGYDEGKVSIVVEKPAPVSVTGGRGYDRLQGDEADDRLKGGNGHDRLDGSDGADKMWGGRSNDVYMVDDRNDRVYEYRSQGSDTVRSSVSYSLSETQVEKLVLAGSGNLNGTGNDLDNSLTGNAGNNVLKGAGGDDKLYGGSGDDKLQGGAGDDRLTGGTGQDTFVFERRGGSDTVTDFRNEHDKIDVSRLAGVDSLADLARWQAGDDVVIWHDSDVLVLKGVDLSDLDSRDFIF